MDFKFDQITFSSNFDSGNLAAVTKVDKTTYKKPVENETMQQSCYDYEFNLWTSPDAAGTPFINPNRTWFFFYVSGVPQYKLVKMNIMNLNKQGKLYGQGYVPLFKIKTSNKPEKWERVREKIHHETVGTDLILTFYHFFADPQAITYFAFSFPWSYSDCQARLEALDSKFPSLDYSISLKSNTVYYHRELLVYSKDGLRVDLITVSDHSGIMDVEEPRFDDRLFPNKNEPRCKMFNNKKIFFVSSRVHPGETPSSHVFNGFLDFILKRADPRAEELRKRYVFKLIPILNPDGVKRGHYRTDQFGVNLNRVYLDPTFLFYPSIYAVKSLLAFYHINCNEAIWKAVNSSSSSSIGSSGGGGSSNAPNVGIIGNGLNVASNDGSSSININLKADRQELGRDVAEDGGSVSSSANLVDGSEKVQVVASVDSDLEDKTLHSNQRQIQFLALSNSTSAQNSRLADSPPDANELIMNSCNKNTFSNSSTTNASDISTTPHLCHPFYLNIPPEKSGLAFYIDLHAHASKKGCFFYGNYFDDVDKQVQCRTYAKLVSLNTGHLDYDGCNFTERNMYAPDKRENQTKEGSGRVAVFKHLGIVHSYTLECNYNTGRLTNLIPHAVGDCGRATPPPVTGIIPQKYTISHFEEVGRALGVAALDMEDANPWSRLLKSEFVTLAGVKEYVRRQLTTEVPSGTSSCPVQSATAATTATAAPFNLNENYSSFHVNKASKSADVKILHSSQQSSKSGKHSTRMAIKMTPINPTHHILNIPNSPPSPNHKSKLLKDSAKKLQMGPMLKSVHPKSIELLTCYNTDLDGSDGRWREKMENKKSKENSRSYWNKLAPAKLLTNRNNHHTFKVSPPSNSRLETPITPRSLMYSSNESLALPNINNIMNSVRHAPSDVIIPKLDTVFPPLPLRTKTDKKFPQKSKLPEIKKPKPVKRFQSQVKVKSMQTPLKVTNNRKPSTPEVSNEYKWPNYSTTNQEINNRRKKMQESYLNPRRVSPQVSHQSLNQMKKQLLNSKRVADELGFLMSRNAKKLGIPASFIKNRLRRNKM